MILLVNWKRLLIEKPEIAGSIRISSSTFSSTSTRTQMRFRGDR
jgi:hypothetical protein